MIHDPIAVEHALLRIERLIPYLRRHVIEYGQDPTEVHREQVRATLTLVWERLDIIAGNTVE